MKQVIICCGLLGLLACGPQEALDTATGSPPADPVPPAPADSIVAEIAARRISGTDYLRGNLDFALQEDGTGEQLWRFIRLEQVAVLYDMRTGIPYLRLTENGPATFGVVFPDSLRRVADGWTDENGFPFANVIEFDGERYLSAYELAERNGGIALLTSGYGDVRYFSALLLQFMKGNCYPKAEYAGPAWREVYRRRRAKAD
ncbi:hypothetical protein [Lewinella sp. IMCC34183]|uniref:hypothetical protein n=1 Tax=Lewinella sp. IMCC34183 TaxID=2248762 RepID=UPI000E224F5A|nr:hypothetical protein [Lewinella sp. IMCC34183]